MVIYKMAIHVQDEEADWLLRDFARRRGLGLTAAIKVAVQEASQNEQQSLEVIKQRLEPIWREIRAARKSTEAHDHRKFVDDMWDH